MKKDDFLRKMIIFSSIFSAISIQCGIHSGIVWYCIILRVYKSTVWFFSSDQCELNYTMQMFLIDPCDRNYMYTIH